ncbi:GNAT family N-acetyltransferase [Acuticoccus mangrovi]|uniref:GNAT family N-acetyltransferase n=1 Tax=Acuticoccus mangrovi TaxID=2796142 RepID=A0A934IQU2_9HYPH|nr:GNAT family N-acetyltransferase [Acuticoccus mangrovi]MBJ3776933.1 GNAT family N-acetyltransferase [Acuticoccus mangrovi]
MDSASLTFAPVDAARFADIERLFGPKGASDGCWCRYWSDPARVWREGTAGERHDAFAAEVASEAPVGLIAYDGETPVGWCRITPRAAVPRFNTTRTGRPDGDIDDVWALTCFYIARTWRGQGLMRRLAEEAVAYAAAHGARAVEAAPIEPKRPLMWGEGYVGIASSLAAAGFEEVERRTPIRPFMRYRV